MAMAPLGQLSHPLDAPWSAWNTLSRLQLSWIWTLLRRGAKCTLSAEDVWPAPCSLTAGAVGSRVEMLWRKECKEATEEKRTPRLMRVLFALVTCSMSLFVGLSVLCGCCFVLAPIFLKAFLEELSTDRRVDSLALWGLAFSCCWGTVSICVSISKYHAQVAGMTWRLAAQHLIYCECLRLPPDWTAGVENPTNLMSVDAERYFVFFNSIMPHAYLLVIALPLLLVAQLGIVPAAVCMVTLLGATYISKSISRVIVRYRRRVMTESDQRLRLSEQYLEGVRVLKMNGWTAVANERLRQVRSAELKHHRLVLFWKGVNLMLSLAAPSICGFCMFASYALLGGEMTAEVVFPSLTVLRSLQLMMGIWPLTFAALADISASHTRVHRFLTKTSRSSSAADSPEVKQAGPLWMKQAVLTRGSGHGSSAHQSGDTVEKSGAPYERDTSSFKLGPVNLDIAKGDLCVICGPVGSGKSTLLLGLLGEVQPSSGESGRPSGNVALCAQEPWITSATLRDNIRCFREAAPEVYWSAVQSAQLLPDLAALPAGESTEIGSRGINISGGQKARVALARALFSAPSPDVVFLDDVLSAVDVHVAQSIIQDALLGSLQGSTRILVANTFLPLLLPHAQWVVVLGEHGAVEAVASPREAMSASAWLRQAVDSMGGCDLDAVPVKPVIPQKQPSSSLTEFLCYTGVPADSKQVASAQDGENVADGSLLIAEERAIGILSFQTYVAYFRQATPGRSAAAGALLFITVFVLVILAEAARTFTEVWVTAWTRSDRSHDINFWICGYAMILAALFLLTLLRTVIWMRLIVQIAARIYSGMIQSIFGASVPLFFDVVPTGRILNRFSKDLDSIDSQLPDFMSEFFQGITYVLASMTLCCVISPYTVIALIPLAAIFIYIRKFYSATSRQLKRLEAVSRSPLYVHFQETLSGLVHIRAFGLTGELLQSFQKKVDSNNKLFFHLYSMIPFLVYRVNMLATTVTVIMTAVVIALREHVDSSLVGLGFSAAAGLIGRLHQCVQTSTEVENHFTSVERLEHFRSVAQEQTNTTVGLPKAEWPQLGEVKFEAVVLRYRPHLPKVLDGVSFQVGAGQRAGLIGRTGSGKSTCMLALLRMVELSGGRVLLDGEDISQIPLQRLRGHALAIIPQDPFLFAGTVRENLDPLGTTTDQEQADALRSAHLSFDLDDMVQGHGANFSVGQRQLLCIARALLRHARVVLLDEASANIDAVTDSLMQTTLRSCFEGSTLLIIAHRLSTVADADLIICMDQGKAVEVGSPAELHRSGGAVAKMFAEAGEHLGVNSGGCKCSL